MVRKTRTVVPKDMVVETVPEIRISLDKRMTVRIVGRKDRTIARIEFSRRAFKVYGARESRPQAFRYRELQEQGARPT